jgi:hypothetical protein
MTDNTIWDNENILETGTDRGGLPCDSNVFARNVAYGAVSQGRSWGMFLRCASHMLIANNTFEGMQGWVFSIGQDSTRYSGGIEGMRILNNVIDTTATGAKVYGFVTAVPASLTIDHDLVWTTGQIASLADGRTTKSLAAFQAWTGLDGHGVSDDPRFVDPAGHDYSLRSASPAVDAGVSIAGVSDTWAGSGPDIGRFERA